MVSFLLRQWFLTGMATATVLAFFFPEWSEALHRLRLFDAGIFLAFLATGLCLETRSILRQVRDIRAPVAAVVSSLFLYPACAWLLAMPILPQEFVIGVCIIGVGPVTVSSGTIMTALARGNVPLSIFICISTSFLAIFTIPLMLNILLSVGGRVDLPVLQMFQGLLLKVLLPILLGQLLRPSLKTTVRKLGAPLSVFQSCIIILIIFRAVSSSADNIGEAGPAIIGIVLFVAFLHGFMLFLNFGLATLLRLDWPSKTAFTIHTSQKTLTVTYIVWAGYFARDFPMAFLPPIICQLTQMSVGTLVAEWFKRRAVTS